MRYKHSAGFNLIELAIAMTISGLLMAGFLQDYSIMSEKARLDTTKQRLDDLRSALMTYAVGHERLPCPASPSGAPPGEDSCAPGALPDKDVIAVSPSPLKQGDQQNEIWIGAVPLRDLRLSNEQGLDGWGNRFTFAVSRRLTLPRGMRGNPVPPGIITVQDEKGNNVLDVAGTGRYVIVSHGPTGAGAWTAQGRQTPCDPVTLDGKNCSGGDTFVVSGFSLVAGSTFYDDIVVYDNANAGGTLLNHLVVCNNKTGFYVPANPMADGDGCVFQSCVWSGACSSVATQSRP
jgi:prepilin-type N-terminal cleavage/methylation domain-containing protein